MELNDQQYIVGIDLGTTNSAVAYVDLTAEDERRRTEIFPIPQLTGAGEISALSVLPSFLYIPGEYDIAKEAVVLPWQRPHDHFAGAFARDHGAKVPARLVASAKSWMCHANADRRAKILPWGAGDSVAKVSPVQAAAAYLSHIRNAWNRAHPDEDAALERQIVIVTVPASFDEVARELTLEAAAAAGLADVILLEEPLAAFYSWLMTHEKNWDQFVNPNELILVCDVGGGTTDFTLIYLRADEGRLGFERLAVGDHLILGGDNIDLALARQVEGQFAGKQFSLKGDRWKTLCHECRRAKERVLNGDAERETITILGTGGKLIGGTLTATLGRQAVEETVLEGFFPTLSASTDQPATQRKGITEFGLPYEQEPAITKHLGWFLERHGADVAANLDKERPIPDLILFNGGSLKPKVIQEQIRRAIGHWFGRSPGETEDGLPRILENPDPDLAVSLGAAYYGLVKIGRGVRVGSGSPRAYYLEVAPADAAKPSRAICLVTRGQEEGTRTELTDYDFKVLANQPAEFNLFSSSYRSGDRRGDLIPIDDSLTALAPLQTIIQYGKKNTKVQIPIRLVAEYTEVGTLALGCRSLSSDHRWQLQFQLRSATAPVAIGDREVFDSALVEAACARVSDLFLDRSAGPSLEGVVKAVATLVERPRHQWPLSFLRALADALLTIPKVRRHSPLHEARWLNLLGYCMRPGLADGADPLRMKRIWRLHGHGPRHGSRVQVRSEWWIFWRRVAAGLTPGQQRQFAQELAPLLTPKKSAPRQIPAQERLEMWMAVANMEQLNANEKARWGRALLAELNPKKSKPQHFWALSRLGARELLYGPVDRVVAAPEVSRWIDRLLETEWRDRKPVVQALAQMARRTGDRTRDLEPGLLDRILQWMADDPKPKKGMAEQRTYLQSVVPMAGQEESQIFGEELPTGIVLRGSS
ncbi:MAG: hsp70 family protein [Desulfosarcinaceae bacterium]